MVSNFNFCIFKVTIFPSENLERSSGIDERDSNWKLSLFGLFFLEEKIICLLITLFRCIGYYNGQQEQFQLFTSILFRIEALKVWSSDQQYKHHLDICDICKFLGPTPNLLYQKLQMELSNWFWPNFYMILMHMQVSELMFKSSLGKRTVLKKRINLKKKRKIWISLTSRRTFLNFVVILY